MMRRPARRCRGPPRSLCATRSGGTISRWTRGPQQPCTSMCTPSHLAAFSSPMVLTMGYPSDVLLARNTTDGQVSCIAPRLVGRDHLPSPCAGREDVCWSCRYPTRPRETTAARSPSSLPTPWAYGDAERGVRLSQSRQFTADDPVPRRQRGAGDRRDVCLWSV